LYAAVDARDAYHRDTAPLVRQLAQAGRMIITTDYIVAETLNWRSRGGAASWLTVSFNSWRLLPVCASSGSVQSDFLRPKHSSASTADHDYSFNRLHTASSFMRELRIRDALTSDHHFVEAGFRTLLKRR
jgi:predicted nucleic acid-binding protein